MVINTTHKILCYMLEMEWTHTRKILCGARIKPSYVLYTGILGTIRMLFRMNRSVLNLITFLNINVQCGHDL